MIAEARNKFELTAYQSALTNVNTNDIAARQAAFAQFIAHGWPHRRMENWRYTSLQRLVQAKLAPVAIFPEEAILPNSFVAPENCLRIIFQAGQWQCLDALPAGLTITTQTQATPIANGVHPMAALNGALYMSGLLIQVAANTQITQPLYILHTIPESFAASSLHMRHRIVLAENANLEVIEHYCSASDIAYHHNIVTEIALQENAQLTYHKIQVESLLAFHTALFDVKQDAHSKFYHSSFALGGQLAREDVQTQLADHAICQLRGAYIPRGTQHMDHHLDVIHAASFSESEMHFKGVLNDKATAVFNGKVLVKPNIQKISAIQKNNNILLSKQCEVNTKPELEIYSDDIRCTHGATVGHIDPAALFYLRARGLSPAEARLMIITAFIQTEINAIKNISLREFVDTIVMSRLLEVCDAV